MNPLFDENEEEVEEEEKYYTKDCILFCIDCNPSMFKKDKEGAIPIKAALDIIRPTIVKKALFHPKDQFGLILYGTRLSHNDTNNENVYVLYPMDSPDPDIIMAIDSVIEDVMLLEEKFGSMEGEFLMGDLLWVISDIFFKSAPKYASKRAFIITNQDNPNSNDTLIRSTAIQRAQDLIGLDTDIQVFGGKTFDPTLFYSTIKNIAGEEAIICHNELESLNTIVESQKAKARSSFHIPFKFAETLSIDIIGYNMIVEQKIPQPDLVYTGGEQIQEVYDENHWICADTKQPLSRWDIKYACDYGGEKVLFTEEEMEEMNYIHDPSIRLLGFRDLKDLKPEHQVTHPYFIYPDEKETPGAHRFFFGLQAKMLNDELIAICSFVRRKNAYRVMCALVPQPEKRDRAGRYIDPPGFQLITLPYADWIRPLPVTFTPDVTPEGLEAVGNLINKMHTRDFDPKNYENPHIRNHYSMVQAIALNTQEEIDFQKDPTMMNKDLMDDEMVNLIQKFKDTVGLNNPTEEELASSGSKRKTGDSSGEGYKKSKGEGISIENLWREGHLTKLTNQSLKDFLSANSIYPKKLKADLVKQVQEFFEEKFAMNQT
ncbi:unnamed protein product [Rhizopus stolonifer]